MTSDELGPCAADAELMSLALFLHNWADRMECEAWAHLFAELAAIELRAIDERRWRGERSPDYSELVRILAWTACAKEAGVVKARVEAARLAAIATGGH